MDADSSSALERAPSPPRDEAGQKQALDVLRLAIERYSEVAFACSFSLEDVALLHLIAKANLPIRLFTLDTGRLPRETIELWQQLLTQYGLKIERYEPDQDVLARSRVAAAPDLIYDDRQARLECCHLRKVEPLTRALVGCRAWITGLRREQSMTRRDLPLIEWDDANDRYKVSPLANWTTENLWSFIRANNIPYNRLYDLGYASIGCAPCTRAIEPGEDIRAGRWWWESPDHRECGIHRRRRA